MEIFVCKFANHKKFREEEMMANCCRFFYEMKMR